MICLFPKYVWDVSEKGTEYYPAIIMHSVLTVYVLIAIIIAGQGNSVVVI